jgi:hypothetical protein
MKIKMNKNMLAFPGDFFRPATFSSDFALLASNNELGFMRLACFLKSNKI